MLKLVRYLKHNHKGDGDNKTELKDSHLNIDLGTALLFSFCSSV